MVLEERLIDSDGRIRRWPKSPADKDSVVRFIASKFQTDNQYSEPQVNNIIGQYHSFNDIALLRRELVSRKFFCREDDGSIYWKL